MRTAALVLLAVLAPLSSLLALPPTPVPQAPPVPPTQPNCSSVEGLAPLLAAGHGLLLGEMHGTVESPAFLADAVCLALQAGRSVTVALEIPLQEKARFEAFLGSAGSAADRTALLAGAFWQDPYQDGRQSAAMLALLESLRQLRHSGNAGAALPVVLLDSTPQAPARDRFMAERLSAAVAQRPQDLFLALTGNYHNRLAPGAPWDAHYEPMGLLLSRLRPDLPLTALDVATTGGTAWISPPARTPAMPAPPRRRRRRRREASPSTPPWTRTATAASTGSAP
ncbi:MAG TPA: hypothetical protein VFE33_06650 [Thermoanaerobaculia bacterium]|nr:hypothetical protein [Thermoanaerobaculia bacterium]